MSVKFGTLIGTVNNMIMISELEVLHLHTFISCNNFDCIIMCLVLEIDNQKLNVDNKSSLLCLQLHIAYLVNFSWEFHIC